MYKIPPAIIKEMIQVAAKTLVHRGVPYFPCLKKSSFAIRGIKVMETIRQMDMPKKPVMPMENRAGWVEKDKIEKAKIVVRAHKITALLVVASASSCPRNLDQALLKRKMLKSIPTPKTKIIKTRLMRLMGIPK